MAGNDVIISQWINNYQYNLKNFDRENMKPLSFLYRSKHYFGQPVIVVNSGPSLDKQISLLKEYQYNAIIISCDSCAFKLIENDIHPDLIVTVDPSHIVQQYFGSFDSRKYTLVFPTTGSYFVLSTWKGNCFLYNQIDRGGTDKGDVLARLISNTEGFGNLPNRGTVSATCCQIASLFCPSVLILIGLDLSFTLDKPYFTGFIANALKTSNKRTYDNVLETLTKDSVWIEGDLYSTKLLLAYKSILTYVLKKELKLNCINCTEGGIFNVIPLASFSSTVIKYCSTKIDKVNLFSQPKKKRGRK